MLESYQSSNETLPQGRTVLKYGECVQAALTRLLSHFGLQLDLVAEDQPIPGSYWGEDEAGLIDQCLLVRANTPVHSILHEACHFICMDSLRRGNLHTDAGGDYDEENAVCFLQIVLAAYLPDMGEARMLWDMDRWGYTFRLGSARDWYETDASDARQWLIDRQLLDTENRPIWQLRKCG